MLHIKCLPTQNNMKTKLLSFLPYVIVLFLSIPLILPYFHSGYFPTHDGLWAVVRLGDMFRELRDHQFPARYSENLNFGYGYPLFNFAYPFPYYLGIIFHFLGFSFISTIKLLFALTVPLSGLGMYIASKKLWGKTFSGIISALLYMYLPYRMVDLYVRGSIGESVSFVIFPLLILSVLFILGKPESKKWIAIGGILLAILVTSHNIMAILFTPTLIAFAVVMGWRKKQVWTSLLFSFLFGVSLSAFFWLPALSEKHLILLSKIPIADRNLYYVTLQQLVIPSWNYGVPDAKNGFTYQLGWPVLLIICLGIAQFFYFLKKKLQVKNFGGLVTFISSILIMVLFLFPFSGFIWEHIPLLKEINYPWTLLGPLGFFMTLFAGSMGVAKNRLIQSIICFALLMEMLLVMPYARPEKYITVDDGYFLTNDATTTSSTEYIPLWVTKWPTQRPEQKVTILDGNVDILQTSSKKIQATITADHDTTVTINTIYYPGWIVKIDNVQKEISYTNPLGIMKVKVPAGQHILLAKFGETPMRLSADIISLFAFLIAIFYLVLSFIPKKKK